VTLQIADHIIVNT